MESERLKRLALVGEVVSAAAVIVTLVFLIIGMRENTNALQAQTFQNLMSELTAWRTSMRDLEASGLMNKWRSSGPEAMSENELLLVRLALLELWGVYESSYFANERGVLGSEEWTRFQNMICLERNGGSAKFWNEEINGLVPFEKILTPAFSAYVQNKCLAEPR